MNELPNLPLIQERFFNSIQSDLIQNDIRYPEFEIIDLFSQDWGSTALGFGGIGGCAITSAYTTIIENVDLMDKETDNIVTENDTVYHLGDVGFGTTEMLKELISRLNGTKILLRGNHDL